MLTLCCGALAQDYAIWKAHLAKACSKYPVLAYTHNIKLPKQFSERQESWQLTKSVGPYHDEKWSHVFANSPFLLVKRRVRPQMNGTSAALLIVTPRAPHPSQSCTLHIAMSYDVMQYHDRGQKILQDGFCQPLVWHWLEWQQSRSAMYYNRFSDVLIASLAKAYSVPGIQDASLNLPDVHPVEIASPDRLSQRHSTVTAISTVSYVRRYTAMQFRETFLCEFNGNSNF